MPDPLLPEDGDYPTGPIDVWPLLAEGPPPVNATVDENGAHHDVKNGRFVKKGRGAHRAPEVAAPTPTPARVNRMIRSVPVGNVGIIGYESNASFNFQNETLIDGSTRRTYSDGTVVLVLPGSPLDVSRVLYKGDDGYSERVNLSVAPKARLASVTELRPSDVRSWAQGKGIPISEKGRIPQAVMDAYRRAHA